LEVLSSVANQVLFGPRSVIRGKYDFNQLEHLLHIDESAES
jgi:hypothetical protein